MPEAPWFSEEKAISSHNKDLSSETTQGKGEGIYNCSNTEVGQKIFCGFAGVCSCTSKALKMFS
jgi:hypothetical protein